MNGARLAVTRSLRRESPISVFLSLLTLARGTSLTKRTAQRRVNSGLNHAQEREAAAVCLTRARAFFPPPAAFLRISSLPSVLYSAGFFPSRFRGNSRPPRGSLYLCARATSSESRRFRRGPRERKLEIRLAMRYGWRNKSARARLLARVLCSFVKSLSLRGKRALCTCAHAAGRHF